MKPPIPHDEMQRLEALRAFEVLDSEPEDRFDRVTALAKRYFDVPIVLVSLVDSDRQWFKSCFGLDVSETSRDVSFCAHAIVENKTFVIPNALEDPRFATNPLVTDDPGIRFYAGALLRTSGGFNLGTLCIIDRKPRPTLTDEEKEVLENLAAIVVDELELRSALVRANESEQMLKEARRSTEELAGAKDKLLSRMNHLFRTPLNAILGFSELLAQEELTEDQLSDVEEIRSAGRRLLHLVEKTIDTSKLLAGEMPVVLTPVPVGSSIIESLDSVDPDRRLSLKVNVDRGLVAVADENLLERVIGEVLTNSIHHGSGDMIQLSAHEDDDAVVIQISDPGKAEETSELQKLLEPFESREGLGLGLTLARGLVESMGGTIELSSDKGLVVTIRLRRAEGGSVGHDVSRILYIDDNAANLSLVAGLLDKRRDVELEVSSSPIAGLQLAREEPPHLILLDLNMLEMQGDDVLRELKNDPRTSDVRVVFVTIEDDKRTLRKLLNAGAYAYITKPLDLTKLLEVIDDALGLAEESA